MAFIVVAYSASGTTMAVSRPNFVSLALSGSGGGAGQVLLNGLGITSAQVGGAVDLKTFFGAAFQSTPLLRAFRLLSSGGDPYTQLIKELAISLAPIGNGVLGEVPGWVALSNIGGTVDIPFLGISGPTGGDGLWRVDIRLRHSIIEG